MSAQKWIVSKNLLKRWVNEPFPDGACASPWWGLRAAADWKSRLSWTSLPPGGQCYYYRVPNLRIQRDSFWECDSPLTFLFVHSGLDRNTCMLFQTDVASHDNLYTPTFSFLSRRPWKLQEEPVCAEGGSWIQNKDQLQGEGVQSFCLLLKTFGGVEMWLQLQWAIFVLGNCWVGYDTCCFLQVNKDIVSGLKYIQQLFRKGVKGEAAAITLLHLFHTHLPLCRDCFLTTCFLASWQVGVHGWQLRSQTKRGVRVPHHLGGVAQRDARPRHLHRKVQVHRWRQTRPSFLGVEPHDQERLERLISLPRSFIDVFLSFSLLFLLSFHLFFIWMHLWILLF